MRAGRLAGPLALLLAAVAVGACAGGRDVRGTLRHGGFARAYLVHVPPSYTGKRPVPLVLVLHGATGNGDAVAQQTGFSRKADAAGFLAVYPDGTGYGRGRRLFWNSGGPGAPMPSVDDVGFLRALIVRLQRDYRVDAKRIYVTGMSNGGMLAYRVGCELADVVAAIAPVAGSLEVDVKPARPVSVVIFHGAQDALVPYDGRRRSGRGGGGSGRAPRWGRRSVADTVAFWVTQDQCHKTPQRSVSGEVTKAVYSGGEAGTEVVLYTIKSGGHAWPGRERYSGPMAGPPTTVPATDLIWDFFAKHPKR